MKKMQLLLMVMMNVWGVLPAVDYSGGYNSNYPSYNPEGDKLILERIHEEIRNDRYLSDNAKHINISIVNGDVTLRGLVDSDEERRLVETLVRRQNGVRNIDNRLYLPTIF